MSFLRSSVLRAIGGRLAAGAALLGIAFVLAACGHASSATPSTAAAPGSQAAAAPSGSASPSASSSGGSPAPGPSGTPSLVPMPASAGGEFVTPSRNITCELGMTKAYCQTGTPARSVIMDANGSYTTCSGDQCLANADPGTPTLAYGTATGVGPFVCASASTGVTCTVKGKGFTISNSGISSASGSSSSGSSASSGSSSSSSGSSSAAFSKALAAWKAAASANAAMMGTYFQQAASDLKESGNPSYGKAISELEYLISLPNTDVSSSQQAQAHTDTEDLDKFFGTPGLNM